MSSHGLKSLPVSRYLAGPRCSVRSPRFFFDFKETGAIARPRDPSIDDRIREAAIRLYNEGGYGALTMTAVAAAAGIGKPALYRRFPTIGDLLFDTSISSSIPPQVPDTGSLRGDMYAMVERLVSVCRDAPRQVMASQYYRAICEVDYARGVEDLHATVTYRHVMVIWDRGVTRGEIDPQMNARECFRDLTSAVALRVLFYHMDLDATAITRLVERFCRAVSPLPA
nr:TetR/AcrR family transcriptional regulator [Oceanicella sp. SM1341]